MPPFQYGFITLSIVSFSPKVAENYYFRHFLSPIIVFGRDQKLALKNGDPTTFRDLFRILYPRMKGYCRLFIQDPMQVEDILQECFLTFWEKRKTIDPDKAVESLLFVMLRNRCLNVLKESRLREGNIAASRLPVNELQHLYHLDFLEKEEKSLEEELILSFHQAIDTLPPRMKEVFLRCKVEGHLQKEVAEDLGISVKAVEKHVAEARERLSRILIRQYPLLAPLITFILQ